MTTKDFIERAIEGGWENWDEQAYVAPTITGVLVGDWQYDIHAVLLDPLAWQAVGKVEGWSKMGYFCASGCGCEEDGELDSSSINNGNHPGAACVPKRDTNHWLNHMHCLIDALAEGKTIEQFLETL